MGLFQSWAAPALRMNSCARDPCAATKLRPHEAWQVLADIIHGDRVVNIGPRRPVVGTNGQAPQDFLKDWLGVDASNGIVNCDSEWRAAYPFQMYGCRCVVSINAEEPIRGGLSLRAPSYANLLSSGCLHEWAHNVFVALSGHLKQGSGQVESDPVSARLNDAHIDLYLMLAHASSILYQ